MAPDISVANRQARWASSIRPSAANAAVHIKSLRHLQRSADSAYSVRPARPIILAMNRRKFIQAAVTTASGLTSGFGMSGTDRSADGLVKWLEQSPREQIPRDLARMVRLQREIGPGGVLIANPIPEDHALDAAAIEKRIGEAVFEARAKGIEAGPQW